MPCRRHYRETSLHTVIIVSYGFTAYRLVIFIQLDAADFMPLFRIYRA